jgi:hypothetical protein
VANVLAMFKSSPATMGDGSIMEANAQGLSIDAFVAGGTYNLSLVRNPTFSIPNILIGFCALFLNLEGRVCKYKRVLHII